MILYRLDSYNLQTKGTESILRYSTLTNVRRIKKSFEEANNNLFISYTIKQEQ